MSKVLVKAYVSPTLVLLAFDWPDGPLPNHDDFLGFAIQRSPGHRADKKPDFLLNKLGFKNSPNNRGPYPSDKAPIQKFLWWDAGISSADRGRQFKYTVYPVCGTGPSNLRLVQNDATTISVQIPHEEEGAIGTYFNRAVVSAQSFVGLVKKTNDNLDKEMDWLANGLQNAIPSFLANATKVKGAIYHLTDNRWVVPAFSRFKGTSSMVYHLKQASAKANANAKAKGKQPNQDIANLAAVKALSSQKRTFAKRTKTSIMHDKFLVRLEDGKPSAVLMGSSNFTPEAFTVQANLLHTFRSSQMAKCYEDRHNLLNKDPAKAATAQKAAWQNVDDIPGTKIRVFFSPEPKGQRKSINAVVNAVKEARSSVLFCMFSPTDPALLKAIMNVGDQQKMMFGLLNSIVDPTKPKKNRVAKDPDKAMANPAPSQQVLTEVFHRSKNQRDIVSFAFFGDKNATAPDGWLPELSTIDTSQYSLSPPTRGIPTVHIHHKFIVIDGETTDPTIYTGSANMSKNSVENNDESLLEIKGNEKLAQMYVAEFFRLYEHYRARSLWNLYNAAGGMTKRKKAVDVLQLATTRDGWVRRAYQKGSLEYISRINLSSQE